MIGPGTLSNSRPTTRPRSITAGRSWIGSTKRPALTALRIAAMRGAGKIVAAHVRRQRNVGAIGAGQRRGHQAGVELGGTEGLEDQRTGVAQPLDLQKIITDNHIDSPESFVDHFASFLLDGQLGQDRRDQLMAYFTTQEKTKRGVEVTVGGKGYPLSRVRGTLYLLLALPEYQLN